MERNSTKIVRKKNKIYKKSEYQCDDKQKRTYDFTSTHTCTHLH